MTRDDNEPQVDQLDAQIRAALSVNPSPQQIDRLKHFWQQQSQADHRRRRVRRAVALAAAILIVVAVSLQIGRNAIQVARPKDTVAPSDPARPDSLAPRSSVDQALVQHEGTSDHVRPATAYEQFIFTARVQERQITQRSTALVAVTTMIDQMARNPKSDARRMLAATDLRRVNLEELLLRQLDRSDDDHQLAIVRILAECGTARSTAALLNLRQRPALHQAALKAIEKTVGFNGLAHAATTTDNPRVRTAICQYLLVRPAAVDAYLTLVANVYLHQEALNVADDLSAPMLEALLTRLDAEDKDTRLAAAFVLGHANGPVVTKALITRVSQQSANSTEAWIALMACRGPQAEEFLTYATGQPRLLGPFNRARVYWARMIN